MKTLNQKIRAMSPARRKKIARRAAQLIAEEMTLRELRRAHKLTQERIAETQGIGQDQVSRLGHPAIVEKYQRLFGDLDNG